jgi:hypothetical protein
MFAGPKVLFCADPLMPMRVDEPFEAEAAVVRELGGLVALIDHDALARGDAGRAVRRVPRDSGHWWYRGWMIPSSAYAALAVALSRRGALLRVPPECYQKAHELPGWYATFREVTPASEWMIWVPGKPPAEHDVAELTRRLGPGPAVVKDFVKARKHEWAEACFIPDTSDLGQATAVVARMVELQQDTLNGGIVLRRFETFTSEAEARVWWVDSFPVSVTAHPGTPGGHPDPDLTRIAPLVKALGCPFITTDLALRADGQWRVVEVGDGQVSGLPDGADPKLLFKRMVTQRWASSRAGS